MESGWNRGCDKSFFSTSSVCQAARTELFACGQLVSKGVLRHTKFMMPVCGPSLQMKDSITSTPVEKIRKCFMLT